MNETTISDMLTDAIRYWEPRRIAYNAILATVVVTIFILHWPESRSAISVDLVQRFFILAVLANVAYCAAYVVDMAVQLSAFRASWKSYRWVLFAIGVVFAGIIARFITAGAFITQLDAKVSREKVVISPWLACSVAVLSLYACAPQGAQPKPTGALCLTEAHFSRRGGAADSVIQALNGAQTTIHVAMYGVTHPGIVDALVAAKVRGVDVALKTDMLESAGKTQAAMIAKLGQAESRWRCPCNQGYCITSSQ